MEQWVNHSIAGQTLRAATHSLYVNRFRLCSGLYGWFLHRLAGQALRLVSPVCNGLLDLPSFIVLPIAIVAGWWQVPLGSYRWFP